MGLFKGDYQRPLLEYGGAMIHPLMAAWDRACAGCAKKPPCKKSCKKITAISARFDNLNERAHERYQKV